MEEALNEMHLMYKLGRFIGRIIYLLDPENDLRKYFRVIRAYPDYIRDLEVYRKNPKAETISLRNLQPQLSDKTTETTFDSTYFYQDIWAFKLILASGVSAHVDIGSHVKYVGFLAAITQVTFIDIRPLEVNINNMACMEGSILDLPFKDDSVESISCLHVAEHIGLGRYGDPLDPEGTRKAARDLTRVLAPGGSLYFSVPVGKPRICFNAHRIHLPQQILDYFHGLDLVSFSGITDRKQFVEGVAPSELADSNYACGLFHFTK
jgi:SAM-dependent methyltransferase